MFQPKMELLSILVIVSDTQYFSIEEEKNVEHILFKRLIYFCFWLFWRFLRYSMNGLVWWFLIKSHFQIVIKSSDNFQRRHNLNGFRRVRINWWSTQHLVWMAMNYMKSHFYRATHAMTSSSSIDNHPNQTKKKKYKRKPNKFSFMVVWYVCVCVCMCVLCNFEHHSKHMTNPVASQQTQPPFLANGFLFRQKDKVNSNNKRAIKLHLDRNQ